MPVDWNVFIQWRPLAFKIRCTWSHTRLQTHAGVERNWRLAGEGLRSNLHLPMSDAPKGWFSLLWPLPIPDLSPREIQCSALIFMLYFRQLCSLACWSAEGSLLFRCLHESEGGFFHVAFHHRGCASSYSTLAQLVVDNGPDWAIPHVKRVAKMMMVISIVSGWLR